MNRHIVFANYSLGEGEVSRTAAVYSEDSLLFAIGNKVHLAGFLVDPCWLLKEGGESQGSLIQNQAVIAEKWTFVFPPGASDVQGALPGSRVCTF